MSIPWPPRFSYLFAFFSSILAPAIYKVPKLVRRGGVCAQKGRKNRRAACHRRAITIITTMCCIRMLTALDVPDNDNKRKRIKSLAILSWPFSFHFRNGQKKVHIVFYK
jgi:hypothetical protein